MKKKFIGGLILLFTPLLLFSAVNLGSPQPLSTSGIKTEKIFSDSSGSVKKLSVSFKKPFTGQVGQYTSLNIENCSMTDKYGYQLPVKVITIDLPKGASVSSVKITNGSWCEIYGKYKLPPSKLVPSLLMKKEDKFVPGTFIEAGYTKMASSTVVSISIYPVQYNPETKKAIFLQNAEIELSYGVENDSYVLTPLSSSGGNIKEQLLGNGHPLRDDTIECIIITPKKYLDYANALKNLHESQGSGGRLGASVLTEVFTIEDIASKPYGETNQPPLASLPASLCPEGDFTNHTGDSFPNRENRIKPRFNDRLARKIISFLLDCHDAPGYENPVSGDQKGYYSMHNLQYVVILGNANEVPPSDYVYSTAFVCGSDGFCNWIPTDYFYSACSNKGLTKEDLYPHIGLGRIPVSYSEADKIFTGLSITEVDSSARTIKVTTEDEPNNVEAGMTVVIKSGSANGRWLDIENASYTGTGPYELTLTLSANRDAGKAWMDGIAKDNTIDIIDTRDQMDSLITKLENWVNARGGDDNWFRSISFAGGIYKACFIKSETATASPGAASLSSIFWDELDCVEAINKVDPKDEGGDDHSYVAGLEVRKYFATDIDKNGNPIDNDAFTKTDIGEVLKNDSSRYTGILYYAGMGSIDQIYLEDGSITSDDVLGYSGSSTKQPIILSQASSTAAFDEEIWYGATPGYTSFGKACLLSGAGSIAYFGSTRVSGEKIYWSRVENGLLTHYTTYTNELTMDILRRYHRAHAESVKTNDIIWKAVGDYYAKNGGSDKFHFRILVAFSLLGDPCIYIPPPAVYYPDDFDEYTTFPTAEPKDPDRINSENIPVYVVNDNSTITIDISHTCETGANNEITLVDCRYYNEEDRKTGTGTYTTPSFDDVDEGKTDETNGPGLYFVRVSQKEKGKDYYTKERRYYFEVVNTFTPSGDILVIDDDQPRRYTSNDNNPDGTETAWQFYYPDYEDYYTDALDALGKSYKVWHVENISGAGNVGGEGRHGEVTEEVLMAYKGEGKAVIWFTGNDWFSTIFSKERDALTNFLKAGGRLFITGQDIGWDIGDTSFYQNVLRASLAQDDIRLFQIDGIGIDDLSSSLSNIIITGGDGADNQRWPSEIDPQSGASSCFLYNPYGSGGGSRKSTGTAGIKYYNSQTKQAHVYFSFGFEAINYEGTASDANSRVAVMDKVLTWLGSPSQTGLFTATGGDSQVVLNWANPNSDSYPGVLILKKEGSYPSTAPTDGESYSAGDTIGEDATVIYSRSPAGTSFTDTDVTNGTTYYYVAYVFNSSYNYQLLGQDYATPQEGGGPGELPEPTNLIATAIEEPEGSGNWKIELSWIYDSTEEISGFQISRKVGETGDWNDEYATVGADTTSYTDTEVDSDTIYYYRVRAYRENGETVYSAWSNVASAATSPMAAPTDLIAVGGEREVWLSWKSNSPGADGFEIYRSHPTPESPDIDSNWVLVYRTEGDSTTYRDPLTSSPYIPDGRPYYYKIRPYKEGVEPQEDWWSDVVWTNPIPSAFPAGEDPTNFEVFPGWNTVVIRFDDNTESESAYYVELWKHTPSYIEYPYATYYLPPFDGATTQETTLTITEGGKYYIRLIAYHKYGYGYSRYATAADSSKSYISFELPESPSGGGGGCFIATAAYGSYQEKHVWILRQFRDKYLLTNRIGKGFVKWYYRHSPKYASIIAKNRFLKFLTRIFLTPLYIFAYILLKANYLLFLLLFLLTTGLVWRTRFLKK